MQYEGPKEEPIVNEKINQDSTRIDKLEDIITNLGTAFSFVKNTPSPPTKIAKLMYVPKNKGESSSKETADLKSISIHPNLFAIIKEPFVTNEFFDLVPKSLIINNKKKLLRMIDASLKNCLPKIHISILAFMPS